jgi:hypothetical protein
VNDTVTEPARISAAALAATELPLNERLVYIRKKKWFGYPLATETLDKLEDLLTYPRSDRMPNLLITGDTNNGKTSLIKEFIKRYPAQDNPDGGAIKVPVFFTQAPPTPDEGRFYDEILEALFAPYKSTYKIGKKEKMVLRLLKVIDARMLVIDEIHNLLAGPINRQQAFLNAIKNLGNNLQIPIVAVGTKEAFRAIHSDGQLANRFRSVYLPKWEYTVEYRRLLSTFEYTLALKEPSNLKDKEMAMEILRMSEGILGEVAEIISEGAVYALRNGHESITMNVLRNMKWVLPSKRAKQA